jgi:hypothetical protein
MFIMSGTVGGSLWIPWDGTLRIFKGSLEGTKKEMWKPVLEFVFEL